MKTTYSLWAKTSKAKNWIKKHLNLDNYQFMGDMIIIEIRYFAEIEYMMKRDGLKQNKDFLYQ